MSAQRERELAAQAVKLGFVEERARFYAPRFRGLVTEDDLISLGNFALARIVREHDEARGTFKAHCRFRISTVMLDGVRAESRAKRIERAGLRATAELLALYRGSAQAEPLEQMERLSHAVAAATFVAMTQEAQRGGNDDDMIAREEYATAMTVIAATLAALPRPQQRLMVLVYEEGHSLTQAQEVLGVHYNTVLNWHDKVLAAVRVTLEKQGITHRPDRGGAPHLSLLRTFKDDRSR